MAIDKTKLTGVEKVYPLNVSPYEQYMGDFQNPSVVSKINAMIQSLHQIGRLTNETVSQWNNVMKWIVEGGMDEIAETVTNEKVSVALEEVMRMLDVSLDNGLKELAENVSDKKIDDLLASGQFESMIQTSLVEINEVVENKLDGFNLQLEDIAYQLPANAFASGDITIPLQLLIEQIKTSDHTEGVPLNTVKGEIKIPAGKYRISKTVTFPSNIKFSGNGKNNTVLLSDINDGSPVFHVNGGSLNGNGQFFHNSFNGFTIFGQYKNCIGIRMDNCSRWSMTDVMITETNGEGLYLYESYLGDIVGLLVRACGDATRGSIVHDGADANNGTHAITYLGGEIAGAPLSIKTIKCGLEIKQGMSNSLFGMTIEGFRGGYGIIEENGVSTNVQGCYFEFNKGDVLILKAESPSYTGNFMTLTEADSKGFIVIQEMNGGVIDGNLFKENFPSLTHIAAYSPTATMKYSRVSYNTVTGFPLRVSQELKAKDFGNTFTSFDGNFDVVTEGRQKFTSRVTFMERLSLSESGDYIEKSKTDNSVIFGANSHFYFQKRLLVPELSLLPLMQSSAVLNSLFVDNEDNALKFKSAFGTVSKVPRYRAGVTVTRPLDAVPGENMFDTSINKAIWYDGSVWRDAMGVTV